MAFKDRWIQQAYEKIKLAYPDDDEETIKNFLSSKFDEQCKNDNKCIVYNNYDKEQVHISLLKLTDWIDTNKPILTESGTMFKQHDKSYNPNSIILKKKLDERKVRKANKFKYLELMQVEPQNKEKYKGLASKEDLAQGRLKVISNSEYGVGGLKSSWFFNIACATATTAKGQALISTAFNAFEDFLADNVKFMNMDECLSFINNICKERESRRKNDSVWVENISDSELVDRLVKKFLNFEICDISLIQKIVGNLSQQDKNRIFYKCNLYEFFRRSEKARMLMEEILMRNVAYLKPMKPHKFIKDNVEKLNDALLEYVHYNYPTVNRTYRLRTQKRKAVIVIDTDSNFINLGPWVRFISEEIMNDNCTKIVKSAYINKDGRYVINGKARDVTAEQEERGIDPRLTSEQKRIFASINTMIFIITNMIDKTLNVFLNRSNVFNNPGTTSMKNEFLNETVLTTPAKKHYQSAIRLQEGVFFNTPELDVKGMEYRKSSMAGASTRAFIEKLVYHDILLPDNGNLDIPKILKKLSRFERDIKESILNGEDKYIKTANIKTADAYDDPMRIGTYKAAYVWNYLYPNRSIELPGVATILKVNLKKPKQFAKLSVTNPDIFDKLMALFKTNESIGKSGINSIAIPLDEPIPEWLKDYINVDEIICNNETLILKILNCLDIKTIYKTKSSQFFSNITDI